MADPRRKIRRRSVPWNLSGEAEYQVRLSEVGSRAEEPELFDSRAFFG